MSRINESEILQFMCESPLKELGRKAYDIKNALHSDKITTFIIDRNINYTNICWVDCKFCAFKRRISEEGGYILSFDEIDAKIDELIAIGGTQILFQGGVHPTLKLEWYENLVRHIHEKYPNITIHGFSAIEIDYIAKVSKVSVDEVLQTLKNAGLSSIPGAGAEVLSDRVRDIIAPKKLDSAEWIAIHRAAHKLDMKTTATMMFGSVDDERDIVNHFKLIRDLQDETGGFRAFILWSFQPDNTPLKAQFPQMQKASSNRYLRYLASARIYLDNFKNIQSSWVTQGAGVGQLALAFGANDLGSTMMEENVVASAGARNSMNTNDMIKVIRDAGEIPAIRDTAYNILKMC
ncbi:dehypoxanthine futalosine cyclase [Helicobacter sp. 23-1044]